MHSAGLLLATICTAALLAANNGGASAAGRFDHCSRPVAPACVENLASYKTKRSLKACTIEMDRYKAMTFSYRRCINKQLEYEVFRTNQFLGKFRCLRKSRGRVTKSCRKFF